MLRSLLGQGSNQNNIDIKSVKFNPESMQHHNFIESKLSQFSEKSEALFAIDRKLGYAMGGDTLVWLSGVFGGWGPYLSMAGYVAIMMALPSYLDRANAASEFEAARDELFELYGWCTNTQPISITNHNDVLAILKAITPYVQDCQSLVPWDLTQVNPSTVSKDFLSTLAEAPHGVKIVLGQNQGYSMSLLAGLFRGGQEEQQDNLTNALNPKQRFMNSKWYGLFNRVSADAACTMYGRKYAKDEEPASQASPQPL